MSICNNRRPRFQTKAAARTGWKTGTSLRKPAGREPSRSSRQKEARTKKPQTMCGDCGFRRRMSTGFQTRLRSSRSRGNVRVLWRVRQVESPRMRFRDGWVRGGFATVAVARQPHANRYYRPKAAARRGSIDQARQQVGFNRRRKPPHLSIASLRLDNNLACRSVDAKGLSSAIPPDEKEIRFPSVAGPLSLMLSVRAGKLLNSIDPFASNDSAATRGEEPAKVVWNRSELRLEGAEGAVRGGHVSNFLESSQPQLRNELAGRGIHHAEATMTQSGQHQSFTVSYRRR